MKQGSYGVTRPTAFQMEMYHKIADSPLFEEETLALHQLFHGMPEARARRDLKVFMRFCEGFQRPSNRLPTLIPTPSN